jgi:hypothetical protein
MSRAAPAIGASSVLLTVQTKQLTWRLDGKTIELGCDWSGQGPKVLLRPALSSISTRCEMRPLQERLNAS